MRGVATRLFTIFWKADPGQTETHFKRGSLEQQLVTVMAHLMRASKAPPEAFERLANSFVGQDT